MESAVPSKAIFGTYKAISNVKSDEEQAESSDSLIMNLNGDDRWRAFQEVIQKRIEALESMDGIIDNTDTVESVGFRYLAIRTTIAHLKWMMKLPEALYQSKQLNEKRGKDNTGK